MGFERSLKSHLRLVLTIAHEFSAYGLPLAAWSAKVCSAWSRPRAYDPRARRAPGGVRGVVDPAYMRRYTIFNAASCARRRPRHGRKLLANLRRIQREVAQTTGERPDAERWRAAKKHTY